MDQPPLKGDDGRFGAILGLELPQQVVHVDLHRGLGQAQGFGNLSVALASGQ